MMDYLPSPTLGTFFPYCRERNARLASVVAGMRRVSVSRTALTLKELIEGNPGVAVRIDEVTGQGLQEKTLTYDATILGVPTRSSEELDETSPPNSGEQLPEKSNLALLKTATGTSVVSLDRIQSITFKDDFKSKLSSEEFRNLLNLKLKWDGPPRDSAEVGMVYLQRGLRWIPSYKVNLRQDGMAQVKLQATLVNELTDLDDVTCNLVIGVPNFTFGDSTDPMAVQNVAAQLSPHFTAANRTAMAFSNAIMSQAPMLQGATNGTIGAQGADENTQDLTGGASAEVSGSQRNEDLFVFTTSHVSLKKGQRMVVPIAEYEMKYRDLYTLSLPFTPPSDVRMYGSQPQREVARAFATPKVMHKIRLSNRSANPLTTAPVLILKDGKLVAQGMSTYTAPNSTCDVTLTSAVEVKVKKTEKETKRTPEAVRLNGDSYSRVDLEGDLELTNFADKPVEIEVKRFVLGKFAGTAQGGKAEMINVFEDVDLATEVSDYSYSRWWGWYNWPSWWQSMNGMGRATWNVTLEPRKPVSLQYKWYYYWR
jgi:hypothetical protein